MPDDIVGYGLGPAGLNNQTISLLGLTCFAKNYGFRISIPRFVNFSTAYLNPKEAVISDVAMSEVFDVDRLKNFYLEHGIQVADNEPFTKRLTNTQMFRLGTEIDNASRFERDGFSARFWTALQPATKLLRLIEKIEVEAFDGQGIDAVVHARLEPDIKRYHDIRIGDNCRHLTYQDLMQIVSTELNGKIKNILLACDETHFKAEEMKKIANQYGFRVAVKGEILQNEVDQSDFLSRSIIDFYLAVRTKIFVGAAYSTFPIIAFSTRLAMTQSNDWAHYTYRYEQREGEKLHRRVRPALLKPVTLPNVSSMSQAEKRLIKLIIHVGSLGDVVSDFGWSYQYGKGCEIQGFEFPSKINDYKIYYRAKLDDNSWTDWVGDGFVGSRGKGRSLKGYSLLVLDKSGLPITFFAAAKFTSGYFCYIEKSGDLVAKTEEDLLCGMQIFLLL